MIDFNELNPDDVAGAAKMMMKLEIFVLGDCKSELVRKACPPKPKNNNGKPITNSEIRKEKGAVKSQFASFGPRTYNYGFVMMHAGLYDYHVTALNLLREALVICESIPAAANESTVLKYRQKAEAYRVAGQRALENLRWALKQYSD